MCAEMTAMFIDVIFLLQPWPILTAVVAGLFLPGLQRTSAPDLSRSWTLGTHWSCQKLKSHESGLIADPFHIFSPLCRKMRRNMTTGHDSMDSIDRVLFQLYVVPSPAMMTPMTKILEKGLINIETDQRNRPEQLQNLVGESGWWLETSHFLRLSWMYWEKAIGLMRHQTLYTSPLCSQRITLYRYAAMIRYVSFSSLISCLVRCLALLVFPVRLKPEGPSMGPSFTGVLA